MKTRKLAGIMLASLLVDYHFAIFHYHHFFSFMKSKIMLHSALLKVSQHTAIRLPIKKYPVTFYNQCISLKFYLHRILQKKLLKF